VSAIAERLSDPGMTALELASAPPSSVKADATLTLGLPPSSVPIELPPADLVPDSVRPAINRYAADASEATHAQLVAAVDHTAQRWEHTIASRGLKVRAELVDACRRAAELHDELVSLHAAARWLRSFRRYLSWDLEPYGLLVGSQEVAVPEMLGAIEDACDVDERLQRIARQRAPREPPYAAPAAPAQRRGSTPARNALAAVGSTLNDVAELMPAGATESAVSLWLAGKRPYPDQLPYALEQLLDADIAARIIRLIPPR
jgi:hypothetical protein